MSSDQESVQVPCACVYCYCRNYAQSFVRETGYCLWCLTPAHVKGPTRPLGRERSGE